LCIDRSVTAGGSQGHAPPYPSPAHERPTHEPARSPPLIPPAGLERRTWTPSAIALAGAKWRPPPLPGTFARRTGAHHPSCRSTVRRTNDERSLAEARGPCDSWRVTTLPGSASLRSSGDRGPRDLGPTSAVTPAFLADTPDKRPHAMRPPLAGPAAPPRRGRVATPPTAPSSPSAPQGAASPDSVNPWTPS
jgi:hypothetical protein